MDKLTRPFSDPYVVLAGCAVGVAVAVAVLLAASPSFAGDGGGLSPDDATTTRKTPTATQPSAQSPTAFPAGFGRRTLRIGARGVDVRYLQSLLGRLGFRTGVDGMFGSGTQAKVRAWERSVRGLVDGRVPPGQAREMLRRAGTAQQSQPAAADTDRAGERVRLPDRGAAQLRDRDQPVRASLRPRPQGPGRPRRLRCPPGGRARRQGLDRRLRRRRRGQLPGDPVHRPHRHGLHAHALARPRQGRPERQRRASSWATSARPATPAPATCTSSCGPRTGGTAAARSTRCRASSSGTRPASRRPATS